MANIKAEDVKRLALGLLDVAKRTPGLSIHGDAIERLKSAIQANKININLINSDNLGRGLITVKKGETRTAYMQLGNLKIPRNIEINLPVGLFKNGKFNPEAIETLSHELTHAILRLDPRYEQAMGLIRKNPRLQILVLTMHNLREGLNKQEAFQKAINEWSRIKSENKDIREIIEERIASASPLHMMWLMGYKSRDILPLAMQRPGELKAPGIGKIKKFREKMKWWIKNVGYKRRMERYENQFRDWVERKLAIESIEEHPEPTPEWAPDSYRLSREFGNKLIRMAFEPEYKPGEFDLEGRERIKERREKREFGEI